MRPNRCPLFELGLETNLFNGNNNLKIRLRTSGLFSPFIIRIIGQGQQIALSPRKSAGGNI